MSAIEPVSMSGTALSRGQSAGLETSASISRTGETGFGDMLMSGLRAVDAKLQTADQLVRQFTVDDSIPVHQVTIALEQARMSVDLAVQVRTRLVEGYRELMNTQL